MVSLPASLVAVGWWSPLCAPPCLTGLLIVIEILRVKCLDFLRRKVLVNTLAADIVRLIYRMHTCWGFLSGSAVLCELSLTLHQVAVSVSGSSRVFKEGPHLELLVHLFCLHALPLLPGSLGACDACAPSLPSLLC